MRTFTTMHYNCALWHQWKHQLHTLMYSWCLTFITAHFHNCALWLCTLTSMTTSTSCFDVCMVCYFYNCALSQLCIMTVHFDINQNIGLNILPFFHWWKQTPIVSLPLWHRWQRDTLCLYRILLGLYLLPMRHIFLKTLQRLLHRYQTQSVLELELTLIMLMFLVFVKWLNKPAIFFLRDISLPLEIMMKGSVFFISPCNWDFASKIF